MARTSDPKSGDIIDAITDSSTQATGTSGGTKTVTTAATRVQLSSSSVPCKRVWVQAWESNSTLDANNPVIVVVGASNVEAAAATRNGQALYPTQGDWFQVSNLNLLWLDATHNLAKVSYFYEI
jgi:hypothetical protein